MTYHRSSPCTRVAGPKLEQPYYTPSKQAVERKTLQLRTFCWPWFSLWILFSFVLSNNWKALILAGDLNLADFDGVVQPPSQWCLDWGTVDFCLFFSEHVGFARQRLLLRGKCFFMFFAVSPLVSGGRIGGAFLQPVIVLSL